jgi:hypothetical protein
MYKKERDPLTKAAIQKFIDDKAQDLAPQDLVSYCLSVCKGFEQYGEKDANFLSFETFTPLNVKFHISDKLIDWHIENLKKNGLGVATKLDRGGYGMIDYLLFGLLKKGTKGRVGKPLETGFLAIHPAFHGDLGDDEDVDRPLKWEATVCGFTSGHFNFNHNAPGFDAVQFEDVGIEYCWDGYIDNQFFQIFNLKEGDKFSRYGFNYYFHSHVQRNQKLTMDLLAK